MVNRHAPLHKRGVSKPDQDIALGASPHAISTQADSMMWQYAAGPWVESAADRALRAIRPRSRRMASMQA
jgi:hypothetical protein